jgi:hypothetical protein
VTTDASSFSVGNLHARAAGQEVIDDFLGDNVGLGEMVGFFYAFISEQEDLGAGFVVTEPLFVLFKPNPQLSPFF